MTAAVAPIMTIQYLDKFKFVQESKKIKDPETLAAYQAEQIESAIETAVVYMKTTSTENNKELATKNDIAVLKEDINLLRTDMKNEFHLVRAEFKEDMNQLRSEFKEDMNQMRSEFKEDMNQMRSAFKEDMNQMRSAFKEDMNQMRSAFKEDMNQLRVDLIYDINKINVNLIKEITKGAVKTENLKYQFLRFIIWTGLGVAMTLGTMIARGYGWI